MYNFRKMSEEEVQAKAAKWGAAAGRNQFARQQSAKWSFAHLFTDVEIIENAEHMAPLQATEFEIALSQVALWCPAFAQAYSDAYRAEKVAYEQRTRPTQPRQMEEW